MGQASETEASASSSRVVDIVCSTSGRRSRNEGVMTWAVTRSRTYGMGEVSQRRPPVTEGEDEAAQEVVGGEREKYGHHHIVEVDEEGGG